MKQSQALDILKSGKNVYLTGAAGSGKTYVLNKYISYLRERGVFVGVTASTGIAATHINGITIHSWSGIGISDDLSDDKIDALTKKKYLLKRFDKARVLIIDEVSMLSSDVFDVVERVSRAMKSSSRPFGGLQVVLSGDFFQLPPIARDRENAQFAYYSDAWRNMNIHTCYLDEQFRHRDKALMDILYEMRSGNVSDNAKNELRKYSENNLPKSVVPIRLYTHNVDVDALNKKELGKLPRKEHRFEMKMKGKANVVDRLKNGVLAPETLELKKGAAVMFVKNNFEGGYVNGTLGTIEGFDGRTPIVKTLSGKNISVFPAEWMVEEDGRVIASVEQLPLRLAWAITVHKSQGMSLDAAEIDLSKSFVPGQGYVALSRLSTLKGLVLRGMNEITFAVHQDAISHDARLLKESLRWEEMISGFGEDEIKRAHKKFIEKSGGTTDEEEIRKSKKRGRVVVGDKKPTHEKTRELMGEGLTIKEIAKKRGLTSNTIISHFEKLKEMSGDIDLSAFKPEENDFRKMKEAFTAVENGKLSSVYRKLQGRYSYEKLRLTRLFL